MTPKLPMIASNRARSGVFPMIDVESQSSQVNFETISTNNNNNNNNNDNDDDEEDAVSVISASLDELMSAKSQDPVRKFPSASPTVSHDDCVGPKS